MGDVEGVRDGADMPRSDNRPSMYREEGKWVWRASGLGNCERNLVLQALGFDPAPPPDAIQAAMDYGTKNEARVIADAKDADVGRDWVWISGERLEQWGEVDDTGQLSLEMRVPGGVVRCHPDGVVVNRRTGETRVAEVKTAARGDGRWDTIHDRYPWQVSIEQHVTGMKLLFVVGWKDDGEYTGDVEVVEVEGPPPHSIGQIKARCARLKKMAEAAEEGGGLDVVGCDRDQYPCGYYADLCGMRETREQRREQKKKDAPDEITDRDLLARVTNICADIAQCRDREKVQRDKRGRLEDELVRVMRDGGKGAGKYVAGSWGVEVEEWGAVDAWVETVPEKEVKHRAKDAGAKVKIRHMDRKGDE